MSYQVNANLQQILTVTETFNIAAPDASGGAPTLSHSGFNVSKSSLSGTSSPAISLMASFAKAMTAGAATIDFTALAGSNGNVDCTGKRIVALLLSNPSSHAITINTGASNGLPLFGASGKLVLNAGASVLLFDPSGTAQAVDATHKNVDISGTGTDSLNVLAVLG